MHIERVQEQENQQEKLFMPQFAITVYRSTVPGFFRRVIACRFCGTETNADSVRHVDHFVETHKC